MRLKTEFLLPVLACWPVSTLAVEWLFEPDFHLTERYTDNLRMQIDPQRDNLITTISPALTMGYLAENQELRGSFRWNELMYHGESELNFSEKIANVNHKYFGERFRTELALQHAEQSSINTQLDLDGSGNVQIQVPRNTRSIAPSATFNISERNALQLGFSYADVTFDRDPERSINLQYSDYDNKQFSATWIHTLTERLSLNATGAYTMFNSSSSFKDQQVVEVLPGFFALVDGISAFSQHSDTINYQVGAQYSLDALTQFSASAGIRNTATKTLTLFDPDNPLLNSSSAEFSSDNSGHVFSLNLDRKYERGTFNVNAGQQLNPASSGFQQNTTTFGATARYNLDERWSTALNASYLQSQSISTRDNQSRSFDRTLYTLSPSLRWRWTPDIHLDLSYSFRQQQFDSLGETATGNNLQLQFSYQPQINRQVK